MLTYLGRRVMGLCRYEDTGLSEEMRDGHCRCEDADLPGEMRDGL